MIRLEIFSGNNTYMFPNGDIATPQIMLEKFPALAHFPHVLEINGDVCQAVMNLNAMREMHNIDPLLSAEEAVVAIQNIINTPEPLPSPSPEERMAAAMEYDNMMKY